MPVFLFTDIEGSTQLWEDHTEAMGSVIARHDAILRDQINACGGGLTKQTGDGVTAAFLEGDPLSCAIGLQQQFALEPWDEIRELRVRIGLHAGDAELRGGDYFGPAVNCTARVMSAAWGGQILVTPNVTTETSLPDDATLFDLGWHLLKGIREPRQIYQLDHPHLLQHEFPPLRTLSGSAIKRAVGSRGFELAGLSAPAIAVGLVSAALSPTLQGDLSPTSPELTQNLSVLGELGAVTLRDWLATFAERLHATRQAEGADAQSSVTHRLELALLELWLAGGEAAAALRSDSSLLLQSLRGVQEAMNAASPQVKDVLAQTLGALGDQFVEFRWVLDGLGDAVADIRAHQDLQLAMQREQLDLQREQLAKTERLLRWQEGERLPDGTPVYSLTQLPSAEAGVPLLLDRFADYSSGVLDLPSLTALYACRSQLKIGQRESPLLVRSALHHGVDVRPWLRRLDSPDRAAQVLRENYELDPRTETRAQIVDALSGLTGASATDALVHVALSEESPEVRSQAALAASRRGRAAETMAGLAAGTTGRDQSAAMAAFVAVADERGIPDHIGDYPKAPVFTALAIRRWKVNSSAILRQTGRSALAGPIVSVLGSTAPLIYYLAYPEDYQRLVTEVFPLPAWAFSGALMFMLIGSFQGATSGFLLAAADSLGKHLRGRVWRWAWGLGSGLALTILLTVLSFWGVTGPEVGPGLYILVYIINGLASGAAATMVIPRLGHKPRFGDLMKRSAPAIVVMAASTVPYAFLLFPSTALQTLMHRLLFGIGFCIALALLFSRRRGDRGQQPVPTED